MSNALLSPPEPSPFAALRLAPADRASLLAGVVERIKTERRDRPVVVFDLDGTLMDNRPRVVRILHELAEAWLHEHPDAAARMKNARDESIVYGFVDNLRRLGITDPALDEPAMEFWKARFFQDHHVRYDIEILGAREYVHACYEAGAVIVYLTGRDLPNMALGSFASLRDLGFPIGLVGTELVVKPRFEMPDADFKRLVAPELVRLGNVVGVFDNEPLNCNFLHAAFPSATTVFIDTQAAPNPPVLDPAVKVIDHFGMKTT